MATLAELMFQSASKSISESTPDIMEAYKTGSQLALKQQELQQQQEALKEKQKAAERQSIAETVKVIDTSLKFKSEADQRRFLRGALPAAAKAYGTENIFTPEMQDMLLNSQDARNAMHMVVNKVRDGSLTFDQGIQFMSQTGMADAIEYNAMQEASKFAESEKGKTERAKLLAGFKEEAATTEFGRTTEKRLKGKIADEFALYEVVGGKASLKQNFTDLNNAVKRLELGEVDTGGITTKLPILKSDEAQSIWNQEMRNVENDARKAIMPLLRATLGAQFTEPEGERIFGTVFDRKAPPAENARRMRAKIAELKATIKSKEAAFVSEGLMPKDAVMTFDEDKKKAPAPPPAEVKAAFSRLTPAQKEALAKKANITVEELTKRMESK